MAIPKLKDDLGVISKLPDLPRATNGYPADVFKAEFDKAGLAIQTFINEKLVPAIVARQIPFTATNQIPETNIQDAIENLQEQIREAASGTIANGSVTKEKIAQALLDRIYGGRPWVALDTPGGTHNSATDFPVGQIWLRPRFIVSNRASTSWVTTGCTVKTEDSEIKMTGAKQAATAKIVQNLTGLGEDGDRVFVLFDVADKDTEITRFTTSVNNESAVDAQGRTIVEAALSVNGALTVQMEAVWPSTSLAGGSVTIRNYTVVNTSQVLRQMSEAHDMADWSGYLSNLLPLSTHTSPAEIFMQVSSGQWWAVGYEVQPVSRGGTGLSEAKANHLLIGNGGEQMKTLAPGAEESLLQMQGGVPGWIPKEDFTKSIGALRTVVTSYVGTGNPRTFMLPVANPKMVYICSNSGPYYYSRIKDKISVLDNPVMLVNGAEAAETFEGYYILSNGYDQHWEEYYSTVKLTNNQLVIDLKIPESTSITSGTPTVLCNRAGVTYTCFVVY